MSDFRSCQSTLSTGSHKGCGERNRRNLEEAHFPKAGHPELRTDLPACTNGTKMSELQAARQDLFEMIEQLKSVYESLVLGATEGLALRYATSHSFANFVFGRATSIRCNTAGALPVFVRPWKAFESHLHSFC